MGDRRLVTLSALVGSGSTESELIRHLLQGIGDMRCDWYDENES